MGDEDLQALLRAARAGEDGAAARWLRALARTGQVGAAELKLAGELEHATARAVAGALEGRMDRPPRIEPLDPRLWRALARAAGLAACEAAAPLPEEAGHLAEVLKGCLDCPCDFHGQVLTRAADALERRVNEESLAAAVRGASRTMVWAASLSACEERDVPPCAAATLGEALLTLAAARTGRWPAEPQREDQVALVRALLPVVLRD